MCVIVVKSPSARFEDAEFRKCWDRNKDGLGFIAIRGNQIAECQKGIMDLEAALAVTRQYRFDDQYTLAVHFRLQSVGGSCAELTHPFDFSNFNLNRLLLHNGTITDLNPAGQDSDTKMAAEILQLLEPPDVDTMLRFFQSTSNSRFVTVTQYPDKVDLKIYSNSESQHENGLWFSNLRHRSYTQEPVKKFHKKYKH